MNNENFPWQSFYQQMEKNNNYEKNMLFFNFMAMNKMPYYNFPSFFPTMPMQNMQNGNNFFQMPQKSIIQDLKPMKNTKELEETAVKKEALVANLPASVLIEEKQNEPEFTKHKDVDDSKTSTSIEKNEGIQRILKYFIQNIGRVRSNRINAEREKYTKNTELLLIFDLLMKKYIMSNKTKEEKIKYILRKGFKYLGNKLKKEHYITRQIKSKKEFDKIFNDFYMSSKKSLNENENDEKNEENKNYKLIFTKESFNKTMNSNFLNTIFSKDSFVEDYKEFLEHFREMSTQDNEDKLSKAVKKLSKLKNLNKCTELSHRFFKRMPWLEVWIEEAEMIAKKLPEKTSSILVREPFFKQFKSKKSKEPIEKQENKPLADLSNPLKRKRANSL